MVMKFLLRFFLHKNILIAVSVFSLLSTNAFASTNVPAGNVSGTWDLASSPYLINGNITVSAGETLIIEPGVVVEFQNWYKLSVNGVLQAIGTSSQQIVFTSTPAGPGEPAWPGIDFIDATGTSQLEYCVIENGQSRAAAPNDRGGAIYISNSSPQIKYCTLRNNTASKYGGAIYCDNGNPLIEGCTITNNSAGFASSAAGGAIYCTNNSQPNIKGNIISHNQVSASGGFSAANALGGGIYLHQSDAVIEKNIISFNSADAQGNVPTHARGGAIYTYYSNPKLTGNTVYGNTTLVYSTPGEGGGLYIYGGNVSMANNIFWNDSAQEIFFNTSGLSSVLIAYSDIAGGEQGIVTSDYSTVNWQEGNISNDPKFTDPSTDDLSLQSNSKAIDAGTAYYEWQGDVIVDLEPTEYSGTAPDMGALEYGSTGGINQAPVAMATATPDHGSSPLTVEFSSSGSSDHDGTIISYSWNFGDGSTSTEQNPTHTYTGLNQYSATLTVTDDDNATNTKAIIINVQDGTTITGGNVSGTWTFAGSPYRIEGDIVVPTGETLTIEPGVTVEFINWYKILVNGKLEAVGTETDSILFTSEPPGPGAPGWIGIDFVDADNTSTLDYCILENGKATAAEPNDRGGALYFVNSSPTVKYSTLRNNQVSRYGGAIYCDNASPLIENCDISNNMAGFGTAASGGAIYSTNNSRPVIRNNRINNNSVGASGGYSAANANGGAICLFQSDAVIDGNIISLNTSSASGNVPTYSRGGAISVWNSSPVITGNTIFGNSASGMNPQGGGIFIYNSHPVAVNNILWNDSPEEIFIASSYNPGTITVTYNDIEGGESEIGIEDNGIVSWQEGNISIDPKFTNTANSDFSLLSSSPCIDAGTAFYEYQGATIVNLNASQYNGNAPDIGALESGFTTPINMSPVAVASASPVSGESPLTVQFNSDGSYDPDGTIVGYFWQSGSLSTTNPNPSYTFSNPGSYTITLTITDDDGATGTDMVSIDVTAPSTNELHIESQDVTRQYSGRKWIGIDQVQVLDQNNQPVAYAMVTANYDGPTSGTTSGFTDNNGLVVLTSGSSKKPRGSWCFEITDVSKNNYLYHVDANIVTIQCETATASKSGLIVDSEEINFDATTLETKVYPNPFKNETTIQFGLEKDQPVSIRIYDITGRLVRSLANNSKLSKGIQTFSWYGEDARGKKLKEGVYFLHLNRIDNLETFKLILMN